MNVIREINQAQLRGTLAKLALDADESITQTSRTAVTLRLPASMPLWHFGMAMVRHVAETADPVTNVRDDIDTITAFIADGTQLRSDEQWTHYTFEEWRLSVSAPEIVQRAGNDETQIDQLLAGLTKSASEIARLRIELTRSNKQIAQLQDRITAAHRMADRIATTYDLQVLADDLRAALAVDTATDTTPTTEES